MKQYFIILYFLVLSSPGANSSVASSGIFMDKYSPRLSSATPSPPSAPLSCSAPVLPIAARGGTLFNSSSLADEGIDLSDQLYDYYEEDNGSKKKRVSGNPQQKVLIYCVKKQVHDNITFILSIQ